MNVKLLGCLFILGSFCAFADTIYVDINDPNASDEPGEGRGTEQLPYRSISAAVNAATADGSDYDFAGGDKILVKPGVYSNDTPYYVSQKYRYTQVYITKPVRLESTGGRDVTALEGLFSEAWRKGAEKATRWGDKSSRCVMVTADGAGTVLKGFTFRNGATRQEDNNTGQGGGVLALANAYVVDSAITNCASAVSGGALEGGTAIRTLIAYNFVNNWSGGLIRNAKLWNCVLRETSLATSSRTYIGMTTVNCTYEMGPVRFCTTTNYNALIEYSGWSSEDKASVLNDHSYQTASLKTSTWDPQTYAPCFFDVRLLSISDAVGIGQTSYLRSVIDIPDEFAATDYYGNAIDYASATCNAGVCQQAVTPPCGAIKMGSGVPSAIDGVPVDNGMYAYPASYPALFRVSPQTGTPCTGSFGMTGASGEIIDPPYYTNTYLVSLPVQADRCTGPWFANANDVVWADANSTSETEDGSEQNPYKTLQAAVDATQAAKSGSKYSVVFVKPGEYATGGKASSDSVMNRVYWKDPGSSRLVVRSTGGAAVTTIRGGTDVRGAWGGMYLMGFTIADCNRTADEDVGVAAHSANLYDCVVTNCTGKIVFTTGSLRRCRVVNNTARLSLCHSASSTFCDFVGNTYKRITAGNNEQLQFVSVARNVVTESTTSNPGSPTHFAFSNIDNAGYKFAARGDDVDTVLWDFECWSHPENYTYADPLFIDSAKNDLRLCTLSPGYGLVSRQPGATEKWSHFLTVDIDGALATDWPEPLSAGPHQKQTLTAFQVNDPSSCLTLEGAEVGLNVVPYGTTRTVKARVAADAKRPVLAFVRTYANGTAVTNSVADLPGGALTFDVSTADTTVTLDIITGSDWYLDPVNGKDTNSGFTPGAAMKTFAALADRDAMLAGDTVHLLPGIYDEGAGLLGVARTRDTLTRMIVPEGVTVVSTEGKEKTIVLGANAPFDAASDGCGSNATRCVYLKANARLEGVTLAGGRTCKAWSNELSGDYFGAAVMAAGKTARVVDCVATNCCGGSVVQGCTAVRCMVDKSGRSGGSIFGGCDVRSSVLRAVNNISKGCVDCYIYDSNILLKGGTTVEKGDSVKGYVYNSIVYGHTDYRCEYYNCVLATNTYFNAWDGSASLNPVNCHDCTITNIAALGFNAYGDDFARPATADCPLVVDAGNNALVPEMDDDTKWALDGAPRVMDYDVDIGAYEWDIRPDVKAALGNRISSVDWVSSNTVVNAAGKVLLDGDGATLTATKRNDSGLATIATFDGTGTLSARVDGIEAASRTTSGLLKINEVKDGAKVEFGFAGDGSATFGRLTSGRGLLVIFR